MCIQEFLVTHRSQFNSVVREFHTSQAELSQNKVRLSYSELLSFLLILIFAISLFWKIKWIGALIKKIISRRWLGYI